MDKAGLEPYHVGALSGKKFPRHGLWWNKPNRDLRKLDWDDIIV